MKNLKEKIKEIEQLISFDYSEMQGWAALRKFVLNKEVVFQNGIRNFKIIETDKLIRLITTIPPLQTFEVHWHDCGERIEVLAGEMGDKLTNRIFETNENIVYSKGERHQPFNPSSFNHCIVLVDFYR